jgi:hypothetical protein
MVRKIGVAAAVFASLIGCASGPAGSTPTPNPAPSANAPPTVEAIVGQYTLVAIDGHALPVVPGRAANKSAWPVVSGTLALQPNGTFRLETVYDRSASEGGRSALQFSGTCYAAGTEVRMVWDAGGLTNLTQRGDTLVLNNDGTMYSYLRR